MNLDWTNIRTVLLDMDGTLLDLHYDNYFWLEHVPHRYAEYHGIELEVARTHLFERFARHSGTLNWYCTDFWSSELALDIVQLKQEIAHLIAVRPDVPDFLNAVRRAGRRIVLVTNAHPDSLDLKMRETGLGSYFDALISSHQIGLPKEHPDFWHSLQSLEAFDAQHTLFVDDSLPVLRSAQRYGIAHLRAINNPDSRQPQKDCGEFAGIGSFLEMMPGALIEHGSTGNPGPECRYLPLKF